MAPIPYNKRKSRMQPRRAPKRQKRRSSVVEEVNNALAIIANPTPTQVAVMAAAARQNAANRIVKRTRSKQEAGPVSAGKFSSSRKSNPFAKYTSKGIVGTKEVGTTVTGTVASYPIYVGHATHGDVNFIFRLFFRALVKTLYMKKGVQLLDIQTESPGSGTFELFYTLDTTNAADTLISVNTAAKSYENISADLYNAFTVARNAGGAAAGLKQIICSHARIINNGQVEAQMDLKSAYVTCYSKSDLKLQNRTVATGTDEDVNTSENVSNQPLYGKSYLAKGNGLLTKTDTAAANSGKSLVAAVNTGLFTLAPDAGMSWLKETPLPTLFTPKPKYSKANIEPGQVKTSTITHTLRIKQTDMWMTFPSIQISPVVSNRLGKCRVFGFEKMITVAEADSRPTIGLELNTRIGLMISTPRKFDTAEVYEEQTFQ